MPEQYSTQIKTIQNKILQSIPQQYQDLVISAFDKSLKYHRNQSRLSGEPFIMHPLRVALSLTHLGLDTNSIIAAILHNLHYMTDAKQTEVRIEEISHEFGEDVRHLIDTMHKFSDATRTDSEKEIITRFIMRSSDDLRPIIIKIADRLDNARTLDALPEEKQKAAAENLVKIYAPLCTYLNLYDFKKELEEIAFKINKPHYYKQIDEKLKSLKLTDTLLKKVEKKLTDLTKGISTEVAIFGRIKGHYSTYLKLQKYQTTLEDLDSKIHDLVAFTILVDTEEQCFEVAKTLFKKTDPIMTSYDNYISNPKDNGYKALQIATYLPGIKDKRIEIQIKTYEMHFFNTYGPASHIAYKLSKQGSKASEYYWIRSVHKQMHQLVTGKVKKRSQPIISELFKSKVYVFTEERELIELPYGATAIDFAYHIHSDLGNQTERAYINGIDKDLGTVLNNGDLIEIITNPKRDLPERAWLQYVRTKKARSAIEEAYKKKVESEDVDFLYKPG